MSNYSQITDFSVKDALPALDPAKYILGSDVDGELTAIATAITSKEDTANKGAASGYAPLNGSSKVASTYLPTDVAYTDVANNFTSAQRMSAGVSATGPLGAMPAAGAFMDYNGGIARFIGYSGSVQLPTLVQGSTLDIGATSGALTMIGTSITANGGVVWHSGNDGAGSNLDADLLDGLDSTAFAQSSTGSFTATLSGMTGATTGTVFWIKTGYRVELYITSSILGTSNVTAMDLTSLPAACIPTNAVFTPCGGVYDNSLLSSAMIGIAAGGSSMSFQPATVSGSHVYYSSSGFTNSGSKGLPAGWRVNYSVY